MLFYDDVISLNLLKTNLWSKILCCFVQICDFGDLWSVCFITLCLHISFEITCFYTTFPTTQLPHFSSCSTSSAILNALRSILLCNPFHKWRSSLGYPFWAVLAPFCLNEIQFPLCSEVLSPLSTLFLPLSKPSFLKQ